MTADDPTNTGGTLPAVDSTTMMEMMKSTTERLTQQYKAKKK